MKRSRKAALEDLLKPVTWSASTSIEYRRHHVHCRHSAVRNAYPFLTKAEKKLADKWIKQEGHNDLWQ
jgi:hypothetical protein